MMQYIPDLVKILVSFTFCVSQKSVFQSLITENAMWHHLGEYFYNNLKEHF